MSFKFCSALLIAFSFFGLGCGSSAIKQRKEVRDRAVQSAKMYCEFVNGDVYPNDVDVALNISVAKHCESGSAVSMTQYKTPSESNGIMFCCPASPSTVEQVTRDNRQAQAAKEAAKEKEAKKEEPKEPSKKSDKAKESKDSKAKSSSAPTSAVPSMTQDELDE
jgi:hypothetical protein